MDGALEESGGIASWARRFFTGEDPAGAEALREQLRRGVRTEGHRRQLLADADALIAEAERAEDGSGASDATSGALYAAIPAYVLAAATAPGIGIAAAAAAAAARSALTSASRKRGAIARYIRALRKVRREVAEAPITPAGHEPVSEAFEPPGPLAESLGGFVKHLAVGDIEGDIKKLRAEAADVQSPAAQAVVLRKVLTMMQKLTAVRHGGARLTRFVHDAAAWFQAHVEGRNAVTEINIRAAEALRELAALRDKLIDMRWTGVSEPKNDERVEKLRAAAAESLARVAAKDNYDF